MYSLVLYSSALLQTVDTFRRRSEAHLVIVKRRRRGRDGGREGVEMERRRG